VRRIPAIVTVATVVGAVAWSGPAEASAGLDKRSFRSPSGRLGCRYSSGTLLCIEKPANPDVSNGTYGSVSATDASAGDVDDFGVGNPTTTLAYGHTWSLAGLSCVMRVTGISCRNRLGRGFQLSRTIDRTF
jgi:hypothetical protein